MRKITLFCLFALSLVASAQVHVLYGIFFEDINYAADGGLYAEMVKNRSFEFPQHLMGWRAFGNFDVEDDGPFERNPHFVRLKYSGHNDKFTGLENEGFFGIAVKEGATYRFSVWARCPEGGKSTLEVSFVDNDTMGEDQRFATVNVEISGKEWKKYTATLKSPRTEPKGALRIFLAGDKATTDVEHISLFPTDTWKGRENGMRKDLAQALFDMHPGVFRFPGGCIVEGTDLDSRYQWKNSVGPVENRPLNENRWHYTFGHRFYPDYFQSYGLGFFEYFQLCEDFGCEPLPVISCGLSCQFQNPDPTKPGVHVALDDLDSYIQDALDLVEFANGPVDSKWGKVRADMGHPAPLKKFNAALRAKYPNLKLIGTTGPNSEGWDFDLLQPRMKQLKVDLYDEHYYRNEKWFLTHGLRYDTYDRKGPKVFAGEYACHGDGKKWNHYETSLYEAAHMTGIERNADIVHMATYAPLFAHVEGWQWRPDAIWFDNLRSFKSVSYYVQQLFAMNKGTNVLSLTMNGKPVAGQEGQDGLFASSVFDAATGQGMKGTRTANIITLTHDGMDDENCLDNPEKIIPVEGTCQVDAGKNASLLLDDIPAKTFRIYKIKK